DEKSPYLQQHADNPVAWQPWDDDALNEAKERDVPIFLSVGYSACHWCHVMEDESFEDEEVAQLLNDNFVPIKVDREERPDVDSVYQTACQLFSGRGGWPLSVWLTPDGRPFYVGTYFPKRAKRGQPGFIDVLEQLADAWENQRGEIEERADEWTQKLESYLEDTPDKDARKTPDNDLLVTAAGQALDEADREYGGFGRSPKFPQTPRLDLLLRAYDRTDKNVFRTVVE
ncbi:MAG: thioredoxin domain-containing protein, partial [Halobacteria archaeon]|nr:thioredoxin domain-containing protein [Halobacteria archaeon]